MVFSAVRTAEVPQELCTNLVSFCTSSSLGAEHQGSIPGPQVCSFWPLHCHELNSALYPINAVFPKEYGIETAATEGKSNSKFMITLLLAASVWWTGWSDTRDVSAQCWQLLQCLAHTGSVPLQHPAAHSSGVSLDHQGWLCSPTTGTLSPCPSGVLQSTPTAPKQPGRARAGQEWAALSLAWRKSVLWTQLCTIDKASQMKNCFPFPEESKISSDADDALNNDNLHSSPLARRELRVHILSFHSAEGT